MRQGASEDFPRLPVTWLDVRHPFFHATIQPQGALLPDGREVGAPFALVVEAGSILVIEGSAMRLSSLLRRLEEELTQRVG